MFEGYEDMLTVEQIMEILSIGRNTAYKLLKEQGIASMRIGNRHRIPKASLINYVMRKCRGNYLSEPK